jgi:hypothetical protein
MRKVPPALTLTAGALLGGAISFCVGHFVVFQPRLTALKDENRELRGNYHHVRVQAARWERDNERLTSNLKRLQLDRMNAGLPSKEEALSGVAATSSPGEQNGFRDEASDLWNAGKKDEAIALLMEVYRSSGSRIDRSRALTELLRFSRTGYTPARDALIALRNEQEAAMLGDGNNRQLLMDVLNLNNLLQDTPRILALHDQIPKDDWRSMWVSMVAFDHLVSARRYNEAVEARPLHRMQALVDHWLNRQAEGLGTREQQMSFDTIGNNIEALVGVGREADAKRLVAQVTKDFSDDATLTLVRDRLNRMGRVDLAEARLRKR